jgi:protein-disulfide isomerase
MRNQSALSVDKLKEYASELALDRARFDAALESGKFKELVDRDIEEGNRLGVDATPTVFINGRLVSNKSYEELKANVEAAFKALSTKRVAQTTLRVNP